MVYIVWRGNGKYEGSKIPTKAHKAICRKCESTFQYPREAVRVKFEWREYMIDLEGYRWALQIKGDSNEKVNFIEGIVYKEINTDQSGPLNPCTHKHMKDLYYLRVKTIMARTTLARKVRSLWGDRIEDNKGGDRRNNYIHTGERGSVNRVEERKDGSARRWSVYS